MDDIDIQVIAPDDYTLLIIVDRDGVADVRSCLPRPVALQAMRELLANMEARYGDG